MKSIAMKRAAGDLLGVNDCVDTAGAMEKSGLNGEVLLWIDARTEDAAVKSAEGLRRLIGEF